MNINGIDGVNKKATNCIYNKKYVVGHFIYFKKAFDTINYDMLLKKLERNERMVALHCYTG